MSETIVHLNGKFLPIEQATIPVLDRGFLFGDGVYEVIPVYGGRLFRLDQHLLRLAHSLAAVRIDNPHSLEEWHTLLNELVQRNGAGDQSLYLQITRGVALRNLAFPQGVTPTVFAMATPVRIHSNVEQGVDAIVVTDTRWLHCDIKAITLLPAVLMRQQAVEQAAAEAIMVRDGMLTEGAACNVFIVRGGVAITPPHSERLLPGITRDLLVDLCHQNGIPCEERNVSETELRHADEVWLTSSPSGVLPVVRLDGKPVGTGEPGPLWRTVSNLYRRYQNDFRAGLVT
jgi:D-alanine transaminase